MPKVEVGAVERSSLISPVPLVLTCVLHMQHNAVHVARVGPLRDQGTAGNDSGPDIIGPIARTGREPRAWRWEGRREARHALFCIPIGGCRGLH